jgi:glycosyltransferase involved in cell wall biosynthesis
LNVLHVIGGGDTGGAMSHLLPLLSALQRTDCNVQLLCLGDGGLAAEAGRRGLPVSVLPMNGARDPRVIRPLRRLLAAGPPTVGRTESSSHSAGAPGAPEPRWDVVHTHGMRANLPVRLAMRTLRPRPCLTTTVHSDLRLDYASGSLARVFQELDRATIGGVDMIICVSDALRSLLLTRGYPAGRLLTVRSGLEKGEITPAETRANGEGTLRRPRVGTVARLVAVKDIDLTLEVAGRLRRNHPEVEVVVVGDGPERERLEALAIEAGLAGVVSFAGRLDGARSAMAEFDVFLVTSVFEGGVSMAVLEAMEQGLPVVTTDAGGVAEAVVDGVTGFVVTRDLERGALAATLAERAAALLDDPALRARMGGAGARRVRDHFMVERTAAQTLRAYERCLVARDRH